LLRVKGKGVRGKGKWGRGKGQRDLYFRGAGGWDKENTIQG